jgi:hypothetical protein
MIDIFTRANLICFMHLLSDARNDMWKHIYYSTSSRVSLYVQLLLKILILQCISISENVLPWFTVIQSIEEHLHLLAMVTLLHLHSSLNHFHLSSHTLGKNPRLSIIWSQLKSGIRFPWFVCCKKIFFFLITKDEEKQMAG